MNQPSERNEVPDVFITILKSEVTELMDENKIMREALNSFINYPGAEEYFGTQIYDKGKTAVSAKQDQED